MVMINDHDHNDDNHDHDFDDIPPYSGHHNENGVIICLFCMIICNIIMIIVMLVITLADSLLRAELPSSSLRSYCPPESTLL